MMMNLWFDRYRFPVAPHTKSESSNEVAEARVLRATTYEFWITAARKGPALMDMGD